MSNKPNLSSKAFIEALKRKNSKAVNEDAFFPVDSNGIPEALPPAALPTKDATGVLDVSGTQVIEIIPGAKLHEQTVMAPIGDLFIPAPDDEGNLGYVRQIADPAADAELDESIRAHGIQQPIIVYIVVRFGIQKLAIMKGGRRYESGLRVGLTHVPVIIRAVTRRMAIRMSYAMTAHNQTLTVPEKARALQQIHADMTAELYEFLEDNNLLQKRGAVRPLLLTSAGWQNKKAQIRDIPDWIDKCFEQAIRSQRRVKVFAEVFSQYVGTSPGRMHDLLRVAKLPPELIAQMSGKQALSLTTINDPKARAQLAREIHHNRLTGTQAKRAAQQLKAPQQPAPVSFTPSRTVQINEADDTPVGHVKNAVREANEAGEKLKTATISEQFRAELLHEIEALERLTAELRRLAQ